jgi:hypothetical protein
MMRVTQYVELESERQVYLRECLRLREVLQKALGFKPVTAPPAASRESSLLEALKTELNRYKRSPADKLNKVRVSPNYSPHKTQANPPKALVTPAKAQATPAKAPVTPAKAQVTPAKSQVTSSPVSSQVTPSTSPVKAHSNPNSSPVKAKGNMREQSSSSDARHRARDSVEDRYEL